ncbi:plasmid replication protein (plasmid) [Candidatus Photodesmus blepharus]|uniref:Plasmid replication protein n=1 Tax=Candidatus Photodesmus blepharonis TaxID=1179155 RepID=A0A084CMC6_9GAMM|nr:ParA family protein [Candidatus Photodesmus blepharus]KEY90955.1 plasmid replication protein [Candidatus Photodesmus blepharus]
MRKQIETLKVLEEISRGASELLDQREKIRPKLPRTFDRPDAVEYLKCDYRTIEKYAAELGINPKAYSENGIRWMLDINQIYKIRDVLPETTLLKKKTKPFKRQSDQKTQVIVVQNQKGGVGKTLSCITVATGIAVEYHEVYRVAVIDMDGQSTLSAYQPSINGDDRTTIGELIQINPETLSYKDFIRDSVSDTTIPNLKIIPATQRDRDIESIFHEGVFNGSIQSPYSRVKNVIEVISGDFDIILIDTPPSLGYASINAYNAATSVIIPLGANQNDTDATCQYLSYLPKIYKNLISQGHEGYDFVKFLLTNYEENSVSSLEIREELNEYFNGYLFSTTFKKSEAVKLCSLEKNSIYDLSKSMYSGHKTTFKNAKLNADQILIDIMLQVRNVWDKETDEYEQEKTCYSSDISKKT